MRSIRTPSEEAALIGIHNHTVDINLSLFVIITYIPALVFGFIPLPLLNFTKSA